MKRFIIPLSFSLITIPFNLFAASTNTVTLKTNSLGYPYSKMFQVDVTFSQPIAGLYSSQVKVANGSIDSIIGSGTNYSMLVTPINPGEVDISILGNSVSSLTNTANKESNLLKINALDPLMRPSSNFNLDGWNLTMPLPLGNSSDALMIKQPVLSGVASANSGYTQAPYFSTDSTTGAMKFFAPLNGATTDNSDYPRTELSEILNWKIANFASNEMISSVRVNKIPPSKKIIIGQIHHKAVIDAYGKSVSAKPLLKITYDLNKLDPNKQTCNGCVYIQIRTIPGSETFLKRVTLAKNIPLNQTFIYDVVLLKDGTLSVKVNNTSTLAKINTSTNNKLGWGMQDLYFKAGVYLLDNGTSSSDGGGVSMDSLQVSHNPK
ncbi:polysaccharide lyase family 7 protein [Legionella sp. km772]|uniref:polysaccharide lyase family 7 protein n=1 Tax=Legionella sp. km772 TaxID=2498111 RepID=UPI0013157294|nr:polysaccharide lyase family 7 protein [Legionella sp. km772]